LPRAGSVLAVFVRVLSAVLAVALIAAGCGGSPARSRSAGVHVDGKRAQGEYVFETDGSGAQFLVPASVVAGQGSRVIDVATPTMAVAGEPSKPRHDRAAALRGRRGLGHRGRASLGPRRSSCHR
jgi:hypothetical protein